MALAGQSFRVDMNLRPEGRDGRLVRTIESYEAYWDRWAEPWEFQALLKARPVAGDRGPRRAASPTPRPDGCGTTRSGPTTSGRSEP